MENEKLKSEESSVDTTGASSVFQGSFMTDRIFSCVDIHHMAGTWLYIEDARDVVDGIVDEKIYDFDNGL